MEFDRREFGNYNHNEPNVKNTRVWKLKCDIASFRGNLLKQAKATWRTGYSPKVEIDA